MSSDEQSEKECPLCMEPFDEINFFPCNCQYQICTFCWHRLRTDDNGLCPACRQPYPEDPVNFQPPSSAEIQKLKNEKKQKQQQKNKISECRKAERQHLSAFRVLQKNLVYVIGLSQRVADPDLLKKTEFFGKFGKIVKVAVGTAQSNANNYAQSTSYTAYVTYGKTEDALRAIQAVNNLIVDGRLVKASLGTTKYCSNFLKGQTCHKQECMYLHEVAEEELSFTKDDMRQGKHTEYEKKLHEQVLSQQPSAIQSQSNNSQAATSSSEPPIFTPLSEPSNTEDELKMKLMSSSDSKMVMTCDELEQILLNNSVPPGFTRQDSVNSCTGNHITSTASMPIPNNSSSGINFFVDLYDDLGFDPFSESSKALADMLEEEKSSAN